MYSKYNYYDWFAKYHLFISVSNSLWIWPLPNTYMYNDIHCNVWCDVLGFCFHHWLIVTCTCEYLMNLFTALQSLLYIYMYIFCMYLNLKAMPEVYCTCVHLLLTCVCGFYHCCILYSTCTCIQKHTYICTLILYIHVLYVASVLARFTVKGVLFVSLWDIFHANKREKSFMWWIFKNTCEHERACYCTCIMLPWQFFPRG